MRQDETACQIRQVKGNNFVRTLSEYTDTPTYKLQFDLLLYGPRKAEK